MRTARLPRLHTLDAWLAYRDFRYLWFGNFFANNAQWLQLLSVGWLVRELSEGSNVAGLLVVTVGGINTLPGLVVGPWGGVLSDRFDRRKLVMALQTAMAVLALAFALLILSGKVQIWHAYLYVILAGCCHSTVQPMRQALIAGTVPREMLGNALATNVLTITGTRIVGPFVGGILIFTLGFFWNFTIEACLYLVNVLMIFRLRTPFHTPGNARQRGSAMSNMIEGLRYVWSGERAFFQLMILSIIPTYNPAPFVVPVSRVHYRGVASRRRRGRLSVGSDRSWRPAGGAHDGHIRVHIPEGEGSAGSSRGQFRHATGFRVFQVDGAGIPFHRGYGIQPGGVPDCPRHVNSDLGAGQPPRTHDQPAELRSGIPGSGQPGCRNSLRRDIAVHGHGNDCGPRPGRFGGMLGCAGPRAAFGLMAAITSGVAASGFRKEYDS